MTNTLRTLLASALTALVATLVFVACDRRPLEVYYDGIVRVRLDYDWEKSFGRTPSTDDILIQIYKDGDRLYRSIRPQNPNSQVLTLGEGRYYVLTYTPEDDWTGSVQFETSDYTHARCWAEDITTRVFKAWDAGTHYMCDPLNPIGVSVDTIDITRDMIERELTFVDYRQRDVVPDTSDYIYPQVPDPMTTRLFVRLLIHGYNSMRTLEANISGMADGFWMNRVDRTNDTGILLLDNWTATPYGQADPAWNSRAQEQTPDTLVEREWGWVTTSIDTFGLPLGKETVDARDSTDNVLRMAFLLVDGTVLTYSFNVGKRMRYRTPSGDALSKAEVLKHIEVEIILDDPRISPDLPPVPPQNENTSGFDAHVDDWEWGGTFDVGLTRQQTLQRQQQNQ